MRFDEVQIGWVFYTTYPIYEHGWYKIGSDKATWGREVLLMAADKKVMLAPYAWVREADDVSDEPYPQIRIQVEVLDRPALDQILRPNWLQLPPHERVSFPIQPGTIIHCWNKWTWDLEV